MTRGRGAAAFAASLLALAPLHAGADAGRTAALTRAVDALRADVNAGADARIWGRYDPGMARAFPPAASAAFFAGLRADHGRWLSTGPVTPTGWTGVCEAVFERGRLGITLTIDAKNRICGLYIRPGRPDLPKPERNTVRLSLPFAGTWYVTNGGDSADVNGHFDNEAQRHAFDFVMQHDGSMHRGDGTANEDYYCWRQAILAPADGDVVEAVDGVADNTPGTMNGYFVPGNWVVIRHADHEYSALAHFARGTVRVKAGDHVVRGQVLGLCGNSGNSSGPHLHYHLMNAPIMTEATGIRVEFDRVTLTRSPATSVTEHCSPVRGDFVSP